MATQTVTELATFEPAAAPPRPVPRKSYEAPASVSVALVAHGPAEATTAPVEAVVLSKARAAVVIAQVCGQLFFSSFCNGIIVVALPSMQTTLGLAEGLLVWPSSSYFLTAGSCLLLAGSVADVVGNKRVNLVGSFFSAVFAMACGLARSGGEIIAFRALQGVTNAIITPSSISIISNNVEEGRPRNMGFAFMGSLSADIYNIHKTSSITLLAIAGCSIPTFVGWMHRQVKMNRTALIPNSLWKSHVFTSCCVMVLLTNALTNCMELYSSLFFQQVQEASAIKASLQVVPSLIAGALTSIATGIFVHRMPVLWMLLISSAMSTVAPFLMALVRTNQLYWENAFFAQILTPISCDLLFTVGLLIISDVFPRHMQALGGAVFNTCAQLGAAIGMSVTQVIASSVTRQSSYADKSSPDALMTGYRIAFWTMFGWMMAVCLVCVLGMRRVGVLGIKRD
ncbi:Drug resistance protein [Colletotrichum sp. SAR11_240]|nr:Drug resistance protein [Colletotrichum sp. SAR11_240]